MSNGGYTGEMSQALLRSTHPGSAGGGIGATPFEKRRLRAELLKIATGIAECFAIVQPVLRWYEGEKWNFLGGKK